MERELLESLVKDTIFLRAWLDFLLKEDDAERTENIRDANEKLDTLFTNGRQALTMNLV